MPSENTIFEVCQYLRNWFDRKQPHFVGDITIENGALPQTYGLKVGQYFRIVGSTLNDGVYQYPVTTLTDETFTGAVWGMALPNIFIELLNDIEAWKNKFNSLDTRDGQQTMSPYNSESFGGYTYSKSNGGSGDTARDKSGTWQGVFGARLQPWRKM